MMIARWKKKISDYFSAARPVGRGPMMAILTVFILLGYTVQTLAQDTINDYDGSSYNINMGACPSGLAQYPPAFVLCVGFGQGSLMANMVWRPTKRLIEQNAEKLAQFLRNQTDGVVEAILHRIHTIELGFIDGWEANWNEHLLPAHKDMARQLHVEIVNQAVYWARMLDARRILGTGGAGGSGGRAAGGHLGMQKADLEDRRTFTGNENSCQVATLGGGYASTSGMVPVFRQGFQKTAVDGALNTRGTRTERGGNSETMRRNDDYNNIFCNPQDNGGVNTCSAQANDPDLYNADIQPTRILFNAVTNPSAASGPKGEKFAKATEVIVENLVGKPVAEPIPQEVMRGDEGKEMWMKRRTYLARYLALRSVPNLIASWKMPSAGGSITQWVRELRRGKNGAPLLPDSELSEKASYREIVHALSVDRPNSSAFASSLIAPQTNLEIEKLTQNTFYLMQLRDYHDLLERTALALAVQVAILVEEANVTGETGNAGATARPQ